MSAPAPGNVVLHLDNEDVIHGQLTRDGNAFDLSGWAGTLAIRQHFSSKASVAEWPITPDSDPSTGLWSVDVTPGMVSDLGVGRYWFVLELDGGGEPTHTPVHGSLVVRRP